MKKRAKKTKRSAKKRSSGVSVSAKKTVRKLKKPSKKRSVSAGAAKKVPAKKRTVSAPIAKKKPAKKRIAGTRAAKKKPAKKAKLLRGRTSRDHVTAKKATPRAKPSATRAAPAAKSKREGFTAKQLAHFRKKLYTERQRVLEEMDELQQSNLKQPVSEQSGENSRYSYHLGDVASLSYGREFSMGLAERQQKYLEQIDEALDRIKQRTYGICMVTKEPIPIERLEEVPVAKYSIEGKEMIEQHRRRMGS